MNKFSKKGFTLVELMVVVVILGALASIGMPYYFKTIETSKANDAIAIGHLLGNSNRMWNLDKGGANFATGQITDACNAGVCPVNPPNTACNLVRCTYVARQNWQQSGDAAYLYYACNPGTGAGGRVTKKDILSQEESEEISKRVVEELNWTEPWFLISSVTRSGTDELVQSVGRALDEMTELEQEQHKEWSLGARNDA